MKQEGEILRVVENIRVKTIQSIAMVLKRRPNTQIVCLRVRCACMRSLYLYAFIYFMDKTCKFGTVKARNYVAASLIASYTES